MLLLEGDRALCILQLAHDLDRDALGLADVKSERGGAGSDRHNPQADPDFDVSLLLSPGQILILSNIAGKSGVGVEFVGVPRAESVSVMLPTIRFLTGLAV